MGMGKVLTQRRRDAEYAEILGLPAAGLETVCDASPAILFIVRLQYAWAADTVMDSNGHTAYTQ